MPSQHDGQFRRFLFAGPGDFASDFRCIAALELFAYMFCFVVFGTSWPDATPGSLRLAGMMMMILRLYFRKSEYMTIIETQSAIG